MKNNINNNKTETNNNTALTNDSAGLSSGRHDVPPIAGPALIGNEELRALLDLLSSTFSRFLILPSHAADTLALWTLHTYAYELHDVTAYLGIESPEKRCGKSTLITVLSEVANRAVVASNISSSAFFRVIQQSKPTLLIDEADTFLRGNDELRGILNSGYTRKTAFVIRVANEPGQPEGDSKGEQKGASNGAFNLRRFSTWCPKAIAVIGRLPDTLSDRCIVIRMQRKLTVEECERSSRFDGAELRARCERVAREHAAAIEAAAPEIPAELNDRAADLWEPLLALAELAGGTWPQRGRNSAVGISTSAQDRSPMGSLLVDLLLCMLREPERKKFLTREILGYLNAVGERPWCSMRKGKEINDMWLAQQLRPYGISPKSVWIEGQVGRGYVFEDCEDVFRRYIPRHEWETRRSEMKAVVEAKAAEAQKVKAPENDQGLMTKDPRPSRAGNARSTDDHGPKNGEGPMSNEEDRSAPSKPERKAA
jgi:hypothetical protein